MSHSDKESSKVSIKSQEICYQGHLSVTRFTLTHRQFDGGWSREINRELLERGNAVVVLLYDPAADAVVLVEQFRIGAVEDKNPWLLELVAGVVESGESDEDVAIRETEEESGLTITSVETIMSYYTSPGICSEKVTLCYAECDSQNVTDFGGLEVEDEDIKVHVIPRSEVMEKIKQGHIRNVNTVVGLQWLQLKLGQ
jgi:ADP-ribose pyrophosphatase